MHETPAQLESLQRLLDESYAGAGAHLKSIMAPERLLSAEQVCAELQGMTFLALATVSAAGDPLVSPVDGIFFQGKYYFGSGNDSVRFRHIRARPQVSATHTRGEELVVTVHGAAKEIDLSAPGWEALRDVHREVYGKLWDEWDELKTAPRAVIEPRVMFAASFKDLVQG
jgi:hypothetical protein